MATANNKLTKEERDTIAKALEMLSTSHGRAAKSAKSAMIAKAFEAEGLHVSNLINRIKSGELDL